MDDASHDFPHLAGRDAHAMHGNSPWHGYVPTPRPWRDMYTSPTRLFPLAAWPQSSAAGAGSRLLEMLDDFPELLSAWTGLLLRNLDFASIVRISRSCRQLRHLGQDPATWKLLSFLTWGPCTASDLALYRGSWRAMFVARPRPRTDGAYIFKWNTVKYGTNEGRGTKDVGKDYYKPVSILCMLRIFIFCHGRRVVMITTNTNSIAPEAVGKALRKLSANSLKKRTTKASNDGLGLVCLGSYDMENNEISSTWQYTPPQFPEMRQLCVRFKQSISSSPSRPNANDVLQTIIHTTGREDEGTYCVLSSPTERPFRFVGFSEDFTAKLMEIPGWPDCNIEGLTAGEANPRHAAKPGAIRVPGDASAGRVKVS